MRKFPRAIEKPSTVPLYREYGATIDFEGSGTLLHIGGSHFMITAAHCADRTDDEDGHGLRIAGADFPVVINRPVLVTPKLSDMKDHPDDVCIVKLLDHEVSKLSERCAFIEEHQIEGLAPRSPSPLFKFIGYPAADNRAEEMLQKVTANAFGIPAFLHTAFVDDRITARPEWYIALRYDEQDHNDAAISGIPPPAMLAGFSGGAIWRDNLHYLPPTFSGMIIEHDQKQKAVLGVSGEGILSLLKLWWGRLHELPPSDFPPFTPPDPGTHPVAGT